MATDPDLVTTATDAISVTMENESDTDNVKLLEDLNSDIAGENLGGIIFVSIIMFIGIIGNIHVLIVYILRMKSSNHRIFILVLAAIDLTTCVIGMPFILVDLSHPLTFTLTAACKILRFLNYFVAVSSLMLMVVIAAERYRKICVPFGGQVSRRGAKCLCLLVLFLAMCLSWPAPVLYGHSTVYIPEYNVTGSQCGNVDHLKDTKYMAFFNVGLILVFIVVFFTLVVLYFLIWRVVRKHVPLSERTVVQTDLAKRDRIQEKQLMSSSSEPSTTSNTCSTSLATDSEGLRVDVKNDKSTKDTHPNLTTRINMAEVHDTEKKPAKKFDAAKRTTLIFLVIAVLMFVSYVPHLVMKIAMFLNKDLVPGFSYTGRFFYKTFIWCFFINNMANPFVYGFYDKQFMKQVSILYGDARRKVHNLLTH